MIARKGLATLINALARLGDSSDQKNWVLWIEGDGPLRESYLQQIEHLQLGNHCRMIGFAQMSLHSFLIRNADVVIVPSQSDAWGIVVDEGMQLGKVVIASRGVGSAIDRITHLENGLLFDAEDEDVLRQSLALVLENHELRKRLSSCAQETTLSFKPVRNQMHLSQILKI
jgi:glycosyltransferase involved in cell wall biosynthesis